VSYYLAVINMPAMVVVHVMIFAYLLKRRQRRPGTAAIGTSTKADEDDIVTATARGSMSTPLSRVITRAAYAATQLPRVAWYVGHGIAMREMSKRARERDGATRPRPVTALPVPDRAQLYADMAKLLQQDLANVEAGIYPLPADHDGPFLALLERSRRFFEDLPEVHRRRQQGGLHEVLSEETRGKRPAYYLQNFHFQSGGWMTRDSAERYDTQVEVLFNGTANAIRR
jgi:hypothetical protein